MSIDLHSRARKIELGLALARRRKVYLDTRFWIILRENASGRRTDAAARKLLHFLRLGVKRGRLVCPISSDLFMELTKQANTATRRQATAELVDELSLGVTSMDPPTLLATETHRFLSAARSDNDRAVSVNMCRNLINQAMKDTQHRSALRTLHVKTSIHAAMRWDKKRLFKVNDWHDFRHATIALTYCDAFLTEGPLHHLVTTRQLDLEKVNGCRVTSLLDQAVEIIQGLLADG